MTKLEELKAMVSVLQKKIEALEKPKQWEPRGNYRIKMSREDTPTMLTIEAAEKASSAMRTYNRLLAYVDEFGGDWEADWDEWGERKFFIQFGHSSDSWILGENRLKEISGAVYMSQDCAEGLVAKLNSGEVVL